MEQTHSLLGIEIYFKENNIRILLIKMIETLQICKIGNHRRWKRVLSKLLALSYDRICSIYIWKLFDNYKIDILFEKYVKVQNRI